MHSEDDRPSPGATASHPQDAAGHEGVDADIEAARWLHDLRNAVNTASVASAVVRRMLEAGMFDDALDMVVELERACARCSAVLAERSPTRVVR